MMDKIEQMQELINEINKHNYNYYTLMNPTISDAEYDKLYYKLVDLENETNIILPSSPTQRVGNYVLKEFKKHKHSVRLYSLNKVRSAGDLSSWVEDMKKFSPNTKFSLEYKFDGLQLVVEYENGRYKRATTRGNGMEGEDVTMQVKTIKTVPLTINFKGKLIVQGEGMMTEESLKKYNETATETLKNARNGVAGAIRNLDPKETAKRDLDFFCYSVLSGAQFNTQEEMHQFLKENGFNTGEYFKLLSSAHEIQEQINFVDGIKTKLNIMIDGMVIKINDCSVREEIGYTNKFPKWAIAYKFEAQEISTILNDVVWQVGRTGKVTPIAILEPVELAGATIQRATLNNIDDINKKKVKIGSRVLIRRSNEVIPEILGLLEELENSKIIEEPTMCPSCGSKLVKKGAILTCLNREGCLEQVIDRISHFASKNAFNIDGLSFKTIKAMIETLKINEPSDLFKLTIEDLLKLDKTKEKKATNIYNAIQNSKQINFDKFIYAIGIPEVGEVSARLLAKNFKCLENLINAKVADLVKIEDIGETIANIIICFFKDPNNIKEIKNLIEVGVKITSQKQEETIDSEYVGKKFVLTGTLFNFTRDEASSLIRKLGGETVSSVSKTTDFVLVGENAGSKKTKAETLNIPLISEEEFLKIVEKYNLK